MENVMYTSLWLKIENILYMYRSMYMYVRKILGFYFQQLGVSRGSKSLGTFFKIVKGNYFNRSFSQKE